ncbi:cytochrome C [Thalassospira sp. HJ]|uniref:c-type cytochrome n=1 Tax=unclassified Thalassospira TaxID=2648997 RepID=UPI0005CED5F4|nr:MULTISPECIES: cytochrome c [unclassified Thalassospira]KJE34936.1 cytochrome C [Thalassospira sp. HJ]MBC07372.1 cytochrome C [Thalassospira sp.]|tara:strand:+ start:3734 stop:4198 length:465 start_codon:yes stop_codon:yes gene_type:complete
MKKLLTAGLLGSIMVVGAAFPMMAQADEASDNALVENRKMLMDGIGGAMGTLGCYMKGQCELPDPVLANLAKGIAFAAGSGPAAFEPQTPDASVKTTAAGDVWTNWDKFAAGFPEMQQAALALADAVGDKGAMGAAMGNLGKTCKGCHDEFRTK